MKKFVKINDKDNVAVALCNVEKGYEENEITAIDNIPFGHKISLTDLKKGETVFKYGYPIGHVTKDVPQGSFIHSHNLKTNLSSTNSYDCKNTNNKFTFKKSNLTFKGYRRKNKKAATRNEIWIISTVGCANKYCDNLASIANAMDLSKIDGVFSYTHPFGCSQLGDDLENTRKVLRGLINNPNAGGVIVVSLGCENNNLNVFKPYLGDVDNDRIRFITLQEVDDEIEIGKKYIKELYQVMRRDKRSDINIKELVVGFKCGGSDAFSGITANALCGKLTDKLTSVGATTILTEVPEMFGAEDILLNRTMNKTVFDKAVNMINGFKDYFISNNQPVYENPSPGNKEGGITTLEEKSLGCVQKGGSAVITDVLSYGDICSKRGLNLLSGPGNDIVSITNLTAAGATLILFSTGRGTPVGAPVPTLKISSNSLLFYKKKGWIDFNAGEIISTGNFDKMLFDITNTVIETASGKKTKSELNSQKQISIFKSGVIL